MKIRDQFLLSLYNSLEKLLRENGFYHIKGPNEPIEWPGQPKNLWPKADVIVDLPDIQVIIETDEDSDPCRSIIKYWPYLEKYAGRKIMLIEIWKRGSTIGKGFFELAQFIGKKFEKTFPEFSYLPKERHAESPQQMARWVLTILQALKKRKSETGNS